MEQIDLDSWEEFEDQLRELRQIRTETAESSAFSTSHFLFRGQREHSWPLVTTLERRVSAPLSLAQYFRLVLVAQPQIETFTGQRWDLPDLPELRDWSMDYEKIRWTQFPGYDYLIYLRHHGFPSPLLDWTRSPYVAAYFAFVDACSDRVAIFAYWEYTGHAKYGSSDEPQIIKFGPYVRSHPRHFLQQSEYTVCCELKESEGWYAPHENVFSVGSKTQHLLWKFTVPVSERPKVLRILESYNLNAFSLFQNEESLLKTISLRELEFREKDL